MNPMRWQKIHDLIARSRDAMVSSVDGGGYPNTKCMFLREHEGLETFWFSTNVSAARTAQFAADPHACVYVVDNERFEGLMLVGEMAVLTDRASRERLWKPGDEQYYPSGVDDPDYCVLRFTACRGNFYDMLKNEDFDVAALA